MVKELIALLADGRIHSGEELGAVLSVSRTAVWKSLKKLDELGIDVLSVKGRGYQLAQPLDLLDPDQIRSYMDADSLHLLAHIDTHDVISSTNELALAQLRLGQVLRGHVILAEGQTAGRGRRGRVWHSPFAQNLYASIVWGYSAGATSLEGLSLAVGVALARALTALGVTGVELKWPNDVLVQGRKLAGVLIELSGDLMGECQVVIGIGLNVQMRSVAAGAVDQPWVTLSDLLGGAVSRNAVAAKVISSVLIALKDYAEGGFSSFKQEWQQYDCLVNKPVIARLGDRVVLGHCTGINQQGLLRVDTPSGQLLLNGGEVSVRSDVRS